MFTTLSELLDFLSIEFKVLLTAAMPVVELRGAIPVGISLGLEPWHAMLLSIVGSMLPVPVILFTVRPVFNWLKKTRAFGTLVEGLTKRSLNNSGQKVQKYGAWGLVLIVAIPLPGTGVWSGSLAAALLNIRFKWAFPAIFAGNLIAAFAVTFLSKGVVNILS